MPPPTARTRASRSAPLSRSQPQMSMTVSIVFSSSEAFIRWPGAPLRFMMPAIWVAAGQLIATLESITTKTWEYFSRHGSRPATVRSTITRLITLSPEYILICSILSSLLISYKDRKLYPMAAVQEAKIFGILRKIRYLCTLNRKVYFPSALLKL